jgi:endonuclease/exonuclease/phosphatase family metal-dependent hydrolase
MDEGKRSLHPHFILVNKNDCSLFIQLKIGEGFYVKKWYAVIVAVMLLFAPLSVQAADDGTDGNGPNNEVTIRVATFNIHAGIGSDGEYNLDRIANTIRESGADIIGLEEVDVHWGSRSNFENEIQILADKLDMNYFFAPIYNMEPSKPGDPRRKYGVALLSKYPILKAENREITRLSTQEANPSPKPAPGFLQAQIHVAGEQVWFYVTHLDYRSDPTVRQMQVSDMLGIMAEHDNHILVGDMNATPEAAELAPLFQQFQDAWALTHDGPGYTYPAESPTKRIDDILTAPGIKVQSANLIDSSASDHRPVTADLVFTPGSHPFPASGIKALVQYLQDRGEFTSDEAAHALEIHLTAVSHYEDKESVGKIVKHMKGFKVLLDHEKENGLISENAYQTLNADADYLINKWQ